MTLRLTNTLTRATGPASIGCDDNETVTLRAMVRIETEALRSACFAVGLPPVDVRSDDKEQLAEAAAG